MRTEIDLPNAEERLYPGMYAEVSLEMNRRPDALTVPAAAVGSDGVGNFVYTITDNRIITRLAIQHWSHRQRSHRGDGWPIERDTGRDDL